MRYIKKRWPTLITVILLIAACRYPVEKVPADIDLHKNDTIVTVKKITRYGMVTGLRPERMAYYKELHAAVWPAVLKKIKACNIRNYSIYLKEIEGRQYLFSYFEYVGDDFDADMNKMASDTATQRWWRETAPTQIPLPDAVAEKQTWSRMTEVFHVD